MEHNFIGFKPPVPHPMYKRFGMFSRCTTGLPSPIRRHREDYNGAAAGEV